jgi:fused signal recognition particle receptor
MLRLFHRKKHATLSQGLFKTRLSLKERLKTFLKSGKVDAGILTELEEILILADIGAKITMEVLGSLKTFIVNKGIKEKEELYVQLKEELKKNFSSSPRTLSLSPQPAVFLFTGVNGSGKTTSLAKLAYRFRNEGRKVLLAAGDTFRAAAIEQLTHWGDKIGVDVIRHDYGGDSAAVAYDAVSAAKSRGMDCVLIDTAGRLQTKMNLMEELKKMARVISKVMPQAPYEKLLVLDATFGRNAISQGRLFHQALGLTGIFLAKLDGSAKGGAILSLENELDVPVKLVGVGEKLEDMVDFNPGEYINSLLNAD